MNDLVSILILAHNKAAYTRRCLDALRASSHEAVKVVLVDNGSTDETPAVFEQHARASIERGWTCEIITLERNEGAIVGRNRGMKYLEGRFAVLMDNDVAPRNLDWMQRLAAFLDANPDVGAVQPKLIYPNPPHRIQCAGCDVSPNGKVNFRGRGAPRDSDAFNTTHDCQALISACWMMPLDVQRKVGPLDERFSPIQFEDTDYCYRIRESGLRTVYFPDVEMYHFENVTSGRTRGLDYTYLTLKNNRKFREKWRHRFSVEGGPPEAEMTWEDLPTIRMEDVGELEQI